MMDVHRVLASRMAASWRLHLVFVVLACVSRTALSLGEDAYFGKHLGKLKELHHGVSGDVYAVDARTLHIRDFTYDGEGPAAYFYVGSSKTPSGAGTRINDEKGSPNVIPRYRKKHITLTLPEGKTLTNIKWFSVWCDEFSVNFGDVRIPKGFAFPKPQKLEALKGIHGVSSENVVIVDAQTLLVPSFSYDGEAPDAKFWVGPGPKPNPQGIRIPDENGKKEHPLRRYDQKTIVLTLPGDMTVFDIGHFGVWCEAFAVDFAHIKIPKTINVPPSLKMLGVSPQCLKTVMLDKKTNQDHMTTTRTQTWKKARSLQQSRYQQALDPYQAQLQQEQQRQQQQYYQATQADESRVDPNQYAVAPNPQSFYQVTTYKPNYHLRSVQSDSFQIVPSISLQQPYYEDRNDAYEVIQPYQPQGVLVNVGGGQHYQQPQQIYQQQQQQPQQQYVLDGAASENQQRRSFSRVSINGAGGQSNTYIQY